MFFSLCIYYNFSTNLLRKVFVVTSIFEAIYVLFFVYLLQFSEFIELEIAALY